MNYTKYIFKRFRKTIFNKVFIFFLIIFTFVLVLRIFKLSFFEYKNDQLYLIKNGIDTRNAHFLVTKGISSGVGINNPPLFSYLMGIVTFFSQDPFWLSSFFSLISTLGLLLAFFYFYNHLPLSYALLSSSILAFSPAFTNYTATIWPQCLLPPLVILHQSSLCKFLEKNDNKYFFLFAALTALISQLHMSGFFLFPVLFIVALIYRNKISVGSFFKSGLAIVLILLPYLYHILFENELAKFISFADTSQRSVYWKIFREHMRMASFDFFRYYFRYDFNDVLNKSLGCLRFILYPLSCILMAFFIFGFVYYVTWLVRGRKIFDESPQAIKRYPLPFQICGFIILMATLCFLIFRIHTPMHYLIIFFPSYSLISAFLAWRLWKFFWVKILISFGILSTLILLVAVLLFLKKAGGHPHEYGPHYGTILAWRQEIRSLVPLGFCPALSLKFNFEKGYDKFDENTINYVIMSDYRCQDKWPKIPLELAVIWDKNLMRYTHSIKLLTKK